LCRRRLQRSKGDAIIIIAVLTSGRIKERCVDNAVGLNDQLWCVWQPEVQSKVDVLGAPPATAAKTTVQA